MREISFEIPGECVAKGRPKFCRWGVYTPKKTKDYESLIQKLFKQQFHEFEPFSNRIKADITVTKAVLKSSSKKDKIKMINNEISPITRPDIDNYIKSILDGLNGLAFVDDSLIVELKAIKKYGETAKVQINLKEI